MIDEKKLIEVINNKIEMLGKGEVSRTDEDVAIGLKAALALIDEQEKIGEWISCSERLPEELEPVNVTWVNHEPEPYYSDIKEMKFVATGVLYRNQWYWYSTYCVDLLAEYGNSEPDKVDKAVEIIAWSPMPEPYKEESNG